ncbi:MAG: FAD-binding oxidoreductase [Candidatus Micrarchaeaceae archaeon]
MIVSKPYIITQIRQCTPTVTSFIFKAEDGTSIDFVPGMFAMVEYRNESTGEKISRAFSIANSPPTNTLEFLISMIHGKFTSKLDTAKINDRYYISAPYGQFKFDIKNENKLLFLAGGTGIAPFMSMIRQMESTKTKTDCKILYSVKFPDEIIEKEELDRFKKDLGIETVVTVTRPKEEDKWIGETGHVNADMIKRHVPDLKDRISYICGPPMFVKALKVALIDLGVEEKKIKAEMWGE